MGKLLRFLVLAGMFTAARAEVLNFTVAPPNPIVLPSTTTRFITTGDFNNATPASGQLGNGTVAAGGNHSCAVHWDASVRCWGRNGRGQLGRGNTTDSNVPLRVINLTNVTGVSAGFEHTCASREGGSVVCWGANDRGQLGDFTTTSSGLPVSVTGLGGSAAVAASAGFLHSCALLASGGVRCWGENLDGQLGNGSNTDSSTAVAVSGISTAVGLVAGGVHSCAVLAAGTVRCWGANYGGQLGNGSTTPSTTPVAVSGITTAVAIISGFDHTCALLADGGLRCWGRNFSGQLGIGVTSAGSSTPLPVTLAGPAVAGSASQGHTCAVLASRELQCWGDNGNGQLGNGTVVGVFPSPEEPIFGQVIAIAAGSNHTCALLSNGTARCFGLNDGGQVGSGSIAQRTGTPEQVVGSAVAVNAGGQTSCALGLSGRLMCWGRSTYGQVGDGSNADRRVPSFVNDSSGRTFAATAVAAGNDHTCAIFGTSGTWCWGLNDFNRLGLGSSAGLEVCSDGMSTHPCSRRPKQLFHGPMPFAIAAGFDHTCHILAGGTAECWGNDNFGQLGTGTANNAGEPRPVAGLDGPITAITAGHGFTCALRDTGAIRCWGLNNEGQLGNGNTNNSGAPVAVSGITTATAIAAGNFHTCARVVGGQVKCWGRGDEGQLGNSTFSDSSTPVNVTNGVNALAVATGGSHSCLRTGSNVSCWGRGTEGQLGIGSFVNQNSAQPVTIGVTVTGVDAGEFHTCASLLDGSLRCWGSNFSGQIGNGSGVTGGFPLPVVVSGLSFDSVALEWSSSNSAVVMIPMSGIATAGGNSGFAVLTATYGPLRESFGFVVAQDGDGDAIPDPADNCLEVPNADQRNTDGDRFGNLCDPDMNNSGFVSAADFNLWRNVLNQACPVPANSQVCNGDFDGSGLVTTADFLILRQYLGLPPGPSGVDPL